MHDEGQLDLRFQMRRSEGESPVYIYVPKAEETKALYLRQTLGALPGGQAVASPLLTSGKLCRVMS